MSIQPTEYQEAMRSWLATGLAAAKKERGATQADLAELLGIDTSNVSKMANGRHEIHPRFIPTIAQFIGTQPPFFSASQAGIGQARTRTPAPNASFPPRYQPFPDQTVPVLGQTVGGPNGRFILNGTEVARVFCPPDLAGVDGAYAVQVYGTSMEPKFEAGETVWLHPRTPVRSGDYVVAQIHNGDGDTPSSYIKQFISMNSRILKLRQLNPEEGESAEIEFPADRVFSVHKIVFHALV